MARQSTTPLFLCFIRLTFLAVRLEGGRTFQNLKASAETISNYDVVQPVILHESEKELWVFISTGRLNFTLQLELNEKLLPRHFTSRYYDLDGNEVVSQGQVNCFYHGNVMDRPEWTVAISTCHGLQGSFGDLGDKSQYFHLEPVATTMHHSLEQPHALYLASEYRERERSCGSKGHTHHSTTINDQLAIAEKRLRRQSSSGFYIVEWVLVNDYRQYQQYGENISATVLRAIEVANFVDMTFKILNVRVVLVDVITWTNGDLIDVVSDADTLLDNFREYRPQVQSIHDSIMLLTGIELDGPTVGIAYTSTMCDDITSVGLSQDDHRAVDFVGSTASHELGHIFNMDHDSAPRENCVCQDETGTCIMAASSGSPPPMQWSSCSRSDLQEGLDDLNLGRCLDNEPTTSVRDPMCGNGIREGDEVCDCGSEEECTDSCCNALTCQLASGAVCSAGPCCQSNCQFRPYGTTCRASSGDCDITEYCPGDSSECPTDVHLQDGISCASGNGYCFSGLCRTFDDQCKFAFGTGSGKGHDVCFTNWNTRGDQYGNCGYNQTNFLPCDHSDVFCGQLHCIPGDFQLDLDFAVTILGTTTQLLNGSTVDCRSYTSVPGSDFQSPGLVADGTKCGDGMLCYSQQCTPTSDLEVRICSFGSNGIMCSGNGKCNNHGECSCNLGFTDDACQKAGSPASAGHVKSLIGALAVLAVRLQISF